MAKENTKGLHQAEGSKEIQVLFSVMNNWQLGLRHTPLQLVLKIEVI